MTDVGSIARSGAPSGLVSPIVGVVVGAAAFYLGTILLLAWESSHGVAALLGLSLLPGACILAGWRWPTAGFSAGSVIILLVLAAWITSYAHPFAEMDGWTDLAGMWARGAANPFILPLGVALLSSAVTGVVSARRM